MQHMCSVRRVILSSVGFDPWTTQVPGSILSSDIIFLSWVGFDPWTIRSRVQFSLVTYFLSWVGFDPWTAQVPGSILSRDISISLGFSLTLNNANAKVRCLVLYKRVY